MGLLVKGEWHRQWYDTKKSGGRFLREDPKFRNWITADGSSGFPAEPGRYHLYSGHASPWSHRTVIVRKLKNLESAIGLSIVDLFMDDDGWKFSDAPGTIPDTVNGANRMYEVYLRAKPDYTGRVTIPVLWDKKLGTIVSNESSEIIRMFNTAFDHIGGEIGNPDVDLYPEEHREEIDALNARIYDTVNNGVYKSGFATTQAAYEEAVIPLFETLDMLEERLANQRFLMGSKPTEADWRLFVTLVRFDPVYHYHFKCNKKRLKDYPNLYNYLKDLYQTPGIAETVNFDHIKGHYYRSHESVNPHRIVPIGPEITLDEPHDRDRFSG